ncbi:unnamed protein product, partial [Timema podura]|nr:unnamed protein product [Timema podura]
LANAQVSCGARLQRTVRSRFESRSGELEAMMERLEESKNMEAVERAKLEEEILAKQDEVTRIQTVVNEKDEQTRKLQEEVEVARQKEEEVKLALLAATTTPQHHHVEENEHDEDDEMVNGDVSRDLATDDNIIDPVEERRTLAERNERLHDQLKYSRSSTG